MILDENRSYYDLLELAPDASPQEIRAAYLRAKSAYKKDSVALYTLISEAETDDLLRQIEEAYQILSSPEKRKAYDQKHASLEMIDSPFAVNASLSGSEDGFFSTAAQAEVISIDRAPPMESGDSGILVAPVTDFSAATGRPEAPAPRAQEPVRATIAPAPSSVTSDAQIQAEIQQEVEWKGSFIRRIREARGVPIEELSDYTKVSKTYLLAIEEENFDRLPAMVFVRGFLIQLAKYLKIPQDKMVVPYLARYTEAKLQKMKG